MRSKGKRNEASASVKVEQMVSDTAEMNGNTAASSQIEESSSSVPMMAYTMERHSVEFIKDFINTYRSFSCLWKMKSPEYCNRHKKADAFDKLIKVSRKYYPAADLRFVKHKIQNLRTVYKKELNKVEASKRSGARTVYTPRLWYFEMMEFTKDQEVTESAESIPSNEEPIIEVKIPSTSCENSEASEMSASAAEETEMCPITVPDETSPMMNAVPHLSTERSRKRNREQMKKTIELLQRAKQLLANPPDEFEGIALNVAGKLRRMSECQRMYCEKLVTDLLMKGLLGELDEDTIIHNRRHVGPPPHPSMSNNSDCMYRYDLNHSTSSSSTNHPDYASY